MRKLTRVDKLIETVGPGLVETVEKHYQDYKEKPSRRTAEKYLTWRLRLHKKLRFKLDLLREINEIRPLGLNDPEPGPVMWGYDFNG